MNKKAHEEYVAHVGEQILMAIEQRLQEDRVERLQELAQAWVTVAGGMPPERSDNPRRATVL